jgi:hypothetical protein
MKEIIVTRTQTAETGTELVVLSSSGKSLSGVPSAHGLFLPVECAQSTTSLSNSHDPENCAATERDIGRKSASDHIRSRLRDINSNKIARRTLQAMVIIGTITLIYQIVSLGPAFQGALAASRGLHVQIQSEADSRQSLAYGFLSDCANRMVCAVPCCVESC